MENWGDTGPQFICNWNDHSIKMIPSISLLRIRGHLRDDSLISRWNLWQLKCIIENIWFNSRDISILFFMFYWDVNWIFQLLIPYSSSGFWKVFFTLSQMKINWCLPGTNLISLFVVIRFYFSLFRTTTVFKNVWCEFNEKMFVWDHQRPPDDSYSTVYNLHCIGMKLLQKLFFFILLFI